MQDAGNKKAFMIIHANTENLNKIPHIVFDKKVFNGIWMQANLAYEDPITRNRTPFCIIHPISPVKFPVEIRRVRTKAGGHCTLCSANFEVTDQSPCGSFYETLDEHIVALLSADREFWKYHEKTIISRDQQNFEGVILHSDYLSRKGTPDEKKAHSTDIRISIPFTGATNDDKGGNPHFSIRMNYLDQYDAVKRAYTTPIIVEGGFNSIPAKSLMMVAFTLLVKKKLNNPQASTNLTAIQCAVELKTDKYAAAPLLSDENEVVFLANSSYDHQAPVVTDVSTTIDTPLSSSSSTPVSSSVAGFKNVNTGTSEHISKKIKLDNDGCNPATSNVNTNNPTKLSAK